jgi:hypothetical protein
LEAEPVPKSVKTFIIFESYFSKSMSLFDRPKSNQKGATEPMVPGPSFIHPGFLNVCRRPWQNVWQFHEAFETDRCFSSMKRSVADSFPGAGCQSIDLENANPIEHISLNLSFQFPLPCH